jgi:hypothetical protein
MNTLNNGRELLMQCQLCGENLGKGKGPPDGWELEDGKTVCHKCCVENTIGIVKEAIHIKSKLLQ